MSSRLKIVLLIGFYFICALITIWIFNGTGDDGDSINHYLYSRKSFYFPKLFFHHWAKPLFTLLSSPFSQFGFVGIKIFNVINIGLTMFFSYKIAEKLKFKNAILAPFLIVFMTGVYRLTFSGLTEPLFAALLSISIYLLLSEKWLKGCVVISFLPFVRSEGLIIIGIIGLLLLIRNQYKFIPFLSVGHLLYGFAGLIYFDSIFWVFEKIPYSSVDSKYGFGSDLFHFIHQTNYIVGLPIYILFLSGIAFTLFKLFKKSISKDFLLFVFLPFLFFYLFHTVAWNFGLFDSMGLNRVLVSVTPLLSIIGLLGLNSLLSFVSHDKVKSGILTSVILVIIIFPFVGNHSSVNWLRDMNLSEKQMFAKSIFNRIDINNNHVYFVSYPYASILLEQNKVHITRIKELKNNLEDMEIDDVIIWDNYFGINNSGIGDLAILKPKFETLYCFDTINESKLIEICILKKGK